MSDIDNIRNRLLENFLINCDVNEIENCLSKNSISYDCVVETIRDLKFSLNPNDELINYLLSLRNDRIIIAITQIRHLKNSIDKYIPLMCKYTTDVRYILRKFVGDYCQSGLSNVERLYCKKLLLILINELESRINLTDMYDINDHYVNSYNIYYGDDAMLYITSRVVNDNMLSSTTIKVIKRLARTAVRNDAPITLINTLLKYVPKDKINSITSLGKLTKFQGNVSLFNEDV